MAGTFKAQSDSLVKRASDPGYKIGWKYKYEFGRGQLDGEMTYAEASKKAEELQAKEPEKAFWPELALERNF